MNMNSILRPIGEIITWTFDSVLIPLGQLPNYVFILVGLVGLFVWLNMQGKFNKKAQKDGTIK